MSKTIDVDKLITAVKFARKLSIINLYKLRGRGIKENSEEIQAEKTAIQVYSQALHGRLD